MVPTGASHQEGDLLLVFATNDGGGTDINTSTTGWSVLGGVGAQSASGGCRSAWMWKIATAASGEEPTITGAADDWAFSFYVIRGAHATYPFGSSPASGTDYSRTNYDLTSVKGAITIAASALTTAADNCLLLVGIGIDAAPSTQGIKPNPDDYVLDSSIVLNSGQVGHVTGHLQFGASGTTPALVSYSNVQEGGNAWLIAVRPASGVYLQKDCRTGGEVIKWFGDFGATLETLTHSSPKTYFDTTTNKIGSLDCSTTAPTVSTLADAKAAPGSFSSFADATNGGADVWAGVSFAIGSTNLSGAVAALRWAMSSTSTPLGTKGVIVMFGSGSTMTTNWAVYQLTNNPAATSGVQANDAYQSAIALGAATLYDSAGTIDWTDVTRVGFAYHRVALSATSRTIYLRNLVALGTAKLIGGSASYPVQLSYLADATKYNGLPFVNTLQGNGQTAAKGKVQIGDGSTKTYFKHEAQSLEYPKSWLITDLERWEWNADASSCGVTVYASASDVIDFSASILATSVKQPFTLHSSSSTSATYNWTGCSLVGYDPTWKTGIDCIGMTFSQCDTVKFKGADVSGVTIKNLHADVGASDAACSFDTSGATMDTCTIDVTGSSAGYHIELGASVTAITLADVTFTGTPGTDKVHVLATTGTVTITISGSTSLSAGDLTSAGAMVDIVAPTASITISNAGLVSGTKVLLWNTTQDAELDIATVGGSGYSFGPVTVGAGEAIEVGDQIDIYGTWASGTSYKKNYHEASVATL